MDPFTEEMFERAKVRQKQIYKHISHTDDNARLPLQESNMLKNLENKLQAAKEQANKLDKSKRKEVVSDSNLNAQPHLYERISKENKSEGNIPRSVQQGTTRVSSDLQGSPDTPTKTLNIQKENFNMEIKLTSAENIRVQVEIEERSDSDEEKENGPADDAPALTSNVKNRLQRLGKLYSDNADLSSPIQRTEGKFHDHDTPERCTKKASAGALGRLKALADTVNQWEDEISTGTKVSEKKESPKKSWKAPAPRPPGSPSVRTPAKGPAPKPPSVQKAKTPPREGSPERSTSPEKKSASDAKDQTKQLAWDDSVLATLESQGFTRTTSNARLVYNYNKDKQTEHDSDSDGGAPHLDLINESDTEDTEPTAEPPVECTAEPPKSTQVSQLASKFADESGGTKKAFQRSPTKSEFRSGGVLNKAAMFEKNQSQSPSKSKDPALLSLSERKALFEKNKGAALVPKAPFGMAPSSKQLDKPTPKGKTSPKKSVVQKQTANDNASPPKKLNSESAGGITGKLKALFENKNTISQNQIINGIHEQKQKDMDILLNRFNRNKETPEEEDSSEDDNADETTKMIQAPVVKIVQFKDNVKSMPPPPPPVPGTSPKKAAAPKRRSKGDSPKVREVLDDVKRIRVSPPKAGRMYPCLSDIEAATETENELTSANATPETSFEDNENYSDSDGPNTSFGKEILDVVCKNQTPTQKRPVFDDSTASDLSDILDDSDAYLDEALAQDNSDATEGPTPPKHSRSITAAAPSHSFHYKNMSASPKKYQSPAKHQSPVKQPQSPKKAAELPTHIVDGNSVLPLTHTVSFYRKQQAQGSRTPVKQVLRQIPLEEEPEPESALPSRNESLKVQKKIQELLDVVAKQQTVISQASQALNLCCSTIEFSGSSEQVEAEKLLLLAAQRRQAALHEVQRLKVEGVLHRNSGAGVERGNLTISDIIIPLKKEYVRALAAAGGKGHHVLCLVRCAEQVLSTKLASTIASPKDALDMELSIPGSVTLENIYSDFTVTLEVYSLQAHEEILPHNVKYHINSKKGGNKLTPKKHKDSKLVMPSVSSPAGPQAVRSSSFALMGYVVFSLQGINRTYWTLNNTPALSPLDGSIQMRVNCELTVSSEHRGFLTMFDDVSGFGAWHRRWCLLRGHNLCYWKYPDDEKKKAPIDSINLKICTTKTVGPVSRDICARPNTLLLETVRPARQEDEDSLVTVCQGNKTLIRHLLSADTKEERTEWCEKFNRALAAVRLWKA